MIDTSLATQFLGEVIGTAILIILGAGVVAGVSLKRSKAENGGWVVITLAWGLGVTMGVYVSGYMSMAHLNPAVTIGMALAGAFRGITYCHIFLLSLSEHLLGQR